MTTPNEEVERVKALREAFVRGAWWAWDAYRDSKGIVPDIMAAAKYPMPTVEVPRVVVINGVEFRTTGGQLQSRSPGGSWSWSAFKSSDLRALLDLIANPIEQKPADEVDE